MSLAEFENIDIIPWDFNAKQSRGWNEAIRSNAVSCLSAFSQLKLFPYCVDTAFIPNLTYSHEQVFNIDET
jgi:hypothetical protein